MFSDYHILESEAFDENHWTTNWCQQHVAFYIHSTTCSLCTTEGVKIMDSFRYQLYALIFYYFYFASGIDSHWKIQEVFSVSNLWMAEPSFSGINTKKKKMTEKLVLLTKYDFFYFGFQIIPI